MLQVSYFKNSRIDDETWDAFCSESPLATFLHTRKYISYHRNRFVDQSLVITVDNKLIALFPAAIDPSNSSKVVSHPGITYGGLIYTSKLRGNLMAEALKLLCAFYKDKSFSSLIYKAVPSFYHHPVMQDDIYSLHQLNATRFRCDLTSIIDLSRRLPVSKLRKRALSKAKSSGQQIVQSFDLIDDVWHLLADNLREKHNQTPVHSLEELKELHSRFPKNILCIFSRIYDEVVAAVILFKTSTVLHAQYICSNQLGRDTSALDLIFAYCLELCTEYGLNFFNFGVSTESNGEVLNTNLYRFKNQFGAGSFVHEFYHIDLNPNYEN